MDILPQFIHFFAALLLLFNFSMLAQRHMIGLIKLLALQGFVLSINTGLIAYTMNQHELYVSAVLTFVLKVCLVPFILYSMLVRLNIRTKSEATVRLPTRLLIGLGLVIFAFNLSLPIEEIAHNAVPAMLALALASVLLSSFMMIIKRKAISQVISLLALENSLFFVACSSPYTMPLLVELGMAFDVLMALFIVGIFFFRINENFDSLDLHHLEKLREE
jgi:hydrogenase-4 component E